MTGFSFSQFTIPSSTSSPFSSFFSTSSSATQPQRFAFGSTPSFSSSPSPSLSTASGFSFGTSAFGSSLSANPSSTPSTVTTSNLFSGSQPSSAPNLFSGSQPSSASKFSTSFGSSSSSSSSFSSGFPASTPTFGVASGSAASSSPAPSFGFPTSSSSAARAGSPLEDFLASSAPSLSTGSTGFFTPSPFGPFGASSSATTVPAFTAASLFGASSPAPSSASASAPPSSGLFSSSSSSSSPFSASSTQAFSFGTGSAFSKNNITSAAAPSLPATASSSLSSLSSSTTSSFSFETPFSSAFQSSFELKTAPSATASTVSTATTSSATEAMPASLGFGASSAPSISSTVMTTGDLLPAASTTPSSALSLFSSQAASSAASTPSVPVSGVTTSLATNTSTSAAKSTSTSAATTSAFPSFSLSTKLAAPTSSSQPQSTTSAAIFGIPASSSGGVSTDSAAKISFTGATSTVAQTSSSLAVASSSGTSSSIVTTAPGPVPKLPSEITGKTVEEIIKEWNSELQERTGKFRTQALAIADWDRKILQNRDVLLRLEIEVSKVVETQTSLERQLELVETHQQEVDKALPSIEEDAQRIYKDERGFLLEDEAAASTRDAMYEKTEFIEREMEQMSEHLKSIIQTLNASQGGDLDAIDASLPTSLGFGAYSASSVFSTVTATGTSLPAESTTPSSAPALFSSQAAGSAADTPRVPVSGVTTALATNTSTSTSKSTTISSATNSPSPFSRFSLSTKTSAPTSSSQPQSTSSAALFVLTLKDGMERKQPEKSDLVEVGVQPDLPAYEVNQAAGSEILRSGPSEAEPCVERMKAENPDLEIGVQPVLLADRVKQEDGSEIMRTGPEGVSPLDKVVDQRETSMRPVDVLADNRSTQDQPVDQSVVQSTPVDKLREFEAATSFRESKLNRIFPNLFVCVEGFLVPRLYVELYRKILLRYGHMATTEVLTDCPLGLMGVATEVMILFEEMASCTKADLSEDLLRRWDFRLSSAELLKFKVDWLRQRLEEVKLSYKHQIENADAIAAARSSLVVTESKLAAVIARREDHLKEKQAAEASLKAAETALETVNATLQQDDEEISVFEAETLGQLVTLSVVEGDFLPGVTLASNLL